MVTQRSYQHVCALAVHFFDVCVVCMHQEIHLTQKNYLLYYVSESTCTV